MENGVTNGNFDEFDFDELEVSSSQEQTRSAKSFANQRRKLKPNRKHVRKSNPIKALQEREDLQSDQSEDDDGGQEADERILKKVKVDDDEFADQTIENGIQDDSSKEEGGVNRRTSSQSQLVGRASLFGTTGKVKGREHALSSDAKKGLESKEDINSASRSLRVTEKDNTTGIGTEKTNPYDGVKEVMLFHVKGGRNVQVRLVKPETSSMNSGDVFVLVTPKLVVQWNGKNCSIMEKAKGAEVTSVIHQWKELGCCAETVHVIDEGHEKPGSNSTKFWKILGDKSDIKQIEDVLEDKEFEKGILASNRFYEITCDNPDDESSECSLQLLPDYSGVVPSKKWLQSDKAYVLDFGTEVYSWIGCKTVGAPRRKAAELGLNKFNEKYRTDAPVHPFDLNCQRLHGSETQPRPPWAVYGRMAEKTENVAFRRKFFDWPDPVNIKVRTELAKAHDQLASDSPTSPTMFPIPASELMEATVEPLMIVDGCFIGRGRGMRDMETLFQWGITLNDLTVWQISGNTFEPLPEHKHGIFYSAEAYVVRWNFKIFRTGINRLKGGKSRQEDTGKDKVIFFFWQGKDCSAGERGQAALRTIELNTDEGPQKLVPQGKEPPAFFQLFDGKMVVHAGKECEDETYNRRRLYWVRNEVEEETCLVEVPMASSSLRSRGSFILVDMEKRREEMMYVWHGTKATETTRKRASTSAHHLNQKTCELHNKKMIILEMNEGEEAEDFWHCFGEDEDYISYSSINRTFDFTPRCFSFDNLQRYFRSVEITSSSYHPQHVCPFPVLQSDLYDLSQPGLVLMDAKTKMFLWEGWWPVADGEGSEKVTTMTAAEKHKFNSNRRLALQSIKSYAEALGRSLDRAFIVRAGCEPLDFKNMFPFWEDREDVTEIQVELGRKKGDKLKVIEVLNQLEREEYTLAELTSSPLPEGVDPTKIEQYLGDQEFQELFNMDKAAFKKAPRWKQLDLKKRVGLF